MRDIKVIEAEISKLQAELEDVKDYESKRNAAVHILTNLGWTHTRGRGWEKPKVNFKVFDEDSMTHIKAGDWVKFDTGTTGGYAYIRSVSGKFAKYSMVTGVTARGAIVSDRIDTMNVFFMKVVSHHDIMKALAFK